MKQAEPFLYPKLSSTYNKIFQLMGAIILIILVMSIWVSSGERNRNKLNEHFHYIAKKQLQQAIAGTAVILEQPYQNKVVQKDFLQRYLDGLAKVNFVKQAHLYDETGLLLVSSVSIEKDKQGNELTAAKPKTINDLYGISPLQRDLSATYKPFVEEIKHSDSDNNKIHGYLRFTIEESYLIDVLAKADKEQQTLQRLMVLLAGLVGFLLTRGLNRFSRRGYRLNDKKGQN